MSDAISLSFFYRNDEHLKGSAPAPHNIDDAFNVVRREGITRVRVTPQEMSAIVAFTLASVPRAPENLQIVKDWKIDRFMGVDLILDEKDHLPNHQG